MDTKICNKCQRELPVSQFHKRNNRPSGYIHQCKECRSIYRKKQSKEYKTQYYPSFDRFQKQPHFYCQIT